MSQFKYAQIKEILNSALLVLLDSKEMLLDFSVIRYKDRTCTRQDVDNESLVQFGVKYDKLCNPCLFNPSDHRCSQFGEVLNVQGEMVQVMVHDEGNMKMNIPLSKFDGRPKEGMSVLLTKEYDGRYSHVELIEEQIQQEEQIAEVEEQGLPPGIQWDINVNNGIRAPEGYYDKIQPKEQAQAIQVPVIEVQSKPIQAVHNLSKQVLGQDENSGSQYPLNVVANPSNNIHQSNINNQPPQVLNLQNPLPFHPIFKMPEQVKQPQTEGNSKIIIQQLLSVIAENSQNITLSDSQAKKMQDTLQFIQKTFQTDAYFMQNINNLIEPPQIKASLFHTCEFCYQNNKTNKLACKHRICSNDLQSLIQASLSQEIPALCTICQAQILCYTCQNLLDTTNQCKICNIPKQCAYCQSTENICYLEQYVSYICGRCCGIHIQSFANQQNNIQISNEKPVQKPLNYQTCQSCQVSQSLSAFDKQECGHSICKICFSINNECILCQIMSEKHCDICNEITEPRNFQYTKCEHNVCVDCYFNEPPGCDICLQNAPAGFNCKSCQEQKNKDMQQELDCGHDICVFCYWERETCPLCDGNPIQRVKMGTCQICFEQLNREEMITLDCDHFFCKGCITQHVKQRIEELHNNGKIICPLCDMEISPFIMEALLDAKDWDRLNKLIMQKMMDIVECPKCREQFQAGEGSKVKCFSCMHRFCKNCKEKWHTGNCEEAERLRIVGEIENQGEKFSQCPGCWTPYLKDDACDHVDCTNPQCGISFCFSCSCIRECTLIHGNHYHRPQCPFYAPFKGNDEFSPDCSQCKKLSKPCPRPKNLRLPRKFQPGEKQQMLITIQIRSSFFFVQKMYFSSSESQLPYQASSSSIKAQQLGYPANQTPSQANSIPNYINPYKSFLIIQEGSSHNYYSPQAAQTQQFSTFQSSSLQHPPPHTPQQSKSQYYPRHSMQNSYQALYPQNYAKAHNPPPHLFHSPLHKTNKPLYHLKAIKSSHSSQARYLQASLSIYQCSLIQPILHLLHNWCVYLGLQDNYELCVLEFCSLSRPRFSKDTLYDPPAPVPRFRRLLYSGAYLQYTQGLLQRVFRSTIRNPRCIRPGGFCRTSCSYRFL